MESSAIATATPYNFGPIAQYSAYDEDQSTADVDGEGSLEGQVQDSYSAHHSSLANATQYEQSEEVQRGFEGEHYMDTANEDDSVAAEGTFAESSDSGMLFNLHPRRETENNADIPAETEPEMLLNLHPRRETENVLSDEGYADHGETTPGLPASQHAPPYGDESDNMLDTQEDDASRDDYADTDDGQEFFMGRRDTEENSNGAERAFDDYNGGDEEGNEEGHQEYEGGAWNDGNANNMEYEQDGAHHIPDMLLEEDDPDMQLPQSARPTEDSQERPEVPAYSVVDEESGKLPDTIHQEMAGVVPRRKTNSDGMKITEMPAGYFNEEYELGSGPQEGEVVKMRSEKGISDTEFKMGMTIVGLATLVLVGAGGGLHAFAATKSATKLMSFLWPVFAVLILAIAFVTWGTGWKQASALQKAVKSAHPFLAVSTNGHELKDCETVLWSDYARRIRGIRQYAESQGIAMGKGSKKRPRTKTLKAEQDLKSILVTGDSDNKSVRDGMKNSEPMTVGSVAEVPAVPYGSLENIDETGYPTAYRTDEEEEEDRDTTLAILYSPDPVEKRRDSDGDSGDEEVEQSYDRTREENAEVGSPFSGSANLEGKIPSDSGSESIDFDNAADAFDAESDELSAASHGSQKEMHTNAAVLLAASQTDSDAGTMAHDAAEEDPDADSNEREWIYHQDDEAKKMDDYGANHVVQEERVDVPLTTSHITPENRKLENSEEEPETSNPTIAVKAPLSNTEILTGISTQENDEAEKLPTTDGYAIDYTSKELPKVLSKSFLFESAGTDDYKAGVGRYDGIYATGGKTEESKPRTMASTTVAEGSFMLHRTTSDLEAVDGAGGEGESKAVPERPHFPTIHSKADIVTDTDTKRAMLHRSLYGSVFN